jgi:hypothetical protein
MIRSAMRAIRRGPLLLTVSVLVGLSAVLAPLGYASLPDQTYLGGLWDGADDDDATLHILSTVATIESFVLCSSDPVLVVVGFTPPLLETAAIPVVVSANQGRAPPVL